MLSETRFAKLVAAVSGTLLVAFLSSCGFTVPPDELAVCTQFESGLSEVAGEPPSTVFEEPGIIKVMHGFGRASNQTGSFITVEQTAELPPYANQATVFLNGWQLRYAVSDHHLAGLGTLIARIRVERGKITWNAAGVLRDGEGEEPFSWTYRYTIIAWNDPTLRAMVDHNDGENDCKPDQPADGTDNYFVAVTDDMMTTALSSFPTFLQNPGFASGRTVAILPRGFGFGWRSLFSDDYHLLQLAYNLESTEMFVRDQRYYKGGIRVNPITNPSTARAAGEFVSWKSGAIIKDNSRRHDYGFGEIVSGMGGADVEVVEPEFVIQPSDTVSGGLGGAGLKSAEVAIENLPYAYAVPMLTGWDIGYTVSDQHVKEIGVWIDDIRYDRPPGAPTGTLRYKVHSILKDNDDYPDNYYAHKVTVLGLRRLPGRLDFRYQQ